MFFRDDDRDAFGVREDAKEGKMLLILPHGMRGRFPRDDFAENTFKHVCIIHSMTAACFEMRYTVLNVKYGEIAPLRVCGV